MPVGRTLLIAPLSAALALAAPVDAQSYVLEFSGGKLVEARSTEGLAPSSGSPAQGPGAPGSVAAAGIGGSALGASAPVATAGRSGTTRSAGVYFRSCAEAARAGYSEMRVGTPGYREGLDGDWDGIACEPYRGRR